MAVQFKTYNKTSVHKQNTINRRKQNTIKQKKPLAPAKAINLHLNRITQTKAYKHLKSTLLEGNFIQFNLALLPKTDQTSNIEYTLPIQKTLFCVMCCQVASDSW